MSDDHTGQGRADWDARATETPDATPHPAYTTPQAEPTGPGQAAAPAEQQVQEEKTWAMVAHLSALSGLLVPLGNILGPLLVWVLGKEKGPFMDDQGKEALNFQIAVMLATLVLGAVAMLGVLLSLILIGIPILIIGMLGMAVVYIGGIVFAIIGAMKANEGQWYRYPYTMRFIK